MSEQATGAPARGDRDPWLAIEMRHLAALATVAQRSSFSGAADRLGYVQSAVSQQIGSLERIVGRRLVERSARPRSVALTDAGRTLLDHVDEILEQLRLAKADIDALATRSDSPVSFGIAVVFGSWLPSTVFGALLPHDGGDGWGRLDLGRSSELLDRVAESRLDAAFVELPILSGPFFALELAQLPLVLAVPVHRVTRDGDAATVLDGCPVVEIDDCAGTVALRELRARAGRPLVAAHAASGPASALSIVRSGAAAAVMTAYDVPPDDPAVAVLPLPELPERTLGLAWRRDHDDCPAVVALREAAHRAVTDRVAAAVASGAPA